MKRYLVLLLSCLVFLLNLPSSYAGFFGPGSFAPSGFTKPPSAELESEAIEEPDEVPSNGTTETPVVTLPYTPPNPETDYWVFFTTQVNYSTASAATSRATIRVRNTTDETVIAETVMPGNPSTTNDWIPVYGFGKYTSEETPSEKDFELSVQAVSGLTAKLRNSVIVIIQSGEGDQYTEAEAETSGAGNTYHDKVTLSWTPDVQTNYLVFAQAEMGNNTGSTGGSGRLVHDGTNYGGGFSQYLWDTTVRRPWLTMVKLTLDAEAQSMKIQFQSTTVTTQTCRRARILALNLDRFSNHFYDEDRTATTNTDNAYTDPVKTEVSGTMARNHIIFGTDITRFTGSQTQIESALFLDDVNTVESLNRPKTITNAAQYGYTFFLKKKNFSAGSHTVEMDFAADGTNTVESQQAALAVLKL